MSHGPSYLRLSLDRIQGLRVVFETNRKAARTDCASSGFPGDVLATQLGNGKGMKGHSLVRFYFKILIAQYIGRWGGPRPPLRLIWQEEDCYASKYSTRSVL